jgi:hypothetical protein
LVIAGNPLVLSLDNLLLLLFCHDCLTSFHCSVDIKLVLSTLTSLLPVCFFTYCWLLAVLHISLMGRFAWSLLYLLASLFMLIALCCRLCSR